MCENPDNVCILVIPVKHSQCCDNSMPLWMFTYVQCSHCHLELVMHYVYLKVWLLWNIYVHSGIRLSHLEHSTVCKEMINSIHTHKECSIHIARFRHLVSMLYAQKGKMLCRKSALVSLKDHVACWRTEWEISLSKLFQKHLLDCQTQADISAKKEQPQRSSCYTDFGKINVES